MVRAGLLSFFFLVPLGYAAAVYPAAAAWASCVLAVLMNGMYAPLAALLYNKTSLADIFLQILYFSLMAIGFTWLMAGPRRIRAVYRFCAAAVLGTLVLLFITFGVSSEFAALIHSQAEMLSSLYISSSGADVVKRSVLETTLTPEIIALTLRALVLRGGALVSVFFMFVINRQLSLAGVWIFKKRRPRQFLPGFHVPVNAIWVLSLSLAGIVLSRFARALIPEITAWNALVLCAILYLAQGMGILFFVLGQKSMPPLPRLLVQALIVMAVISPGINTIALGLLMLLGIAENWLPLRTPPKQESIR